MILTLRRLSATNQKDRHQIADALSELTCRKDMARVLEAFFPGVAERYEFQGSARKALNRAGERKDVSSFVLMLVQGNYCRPGDVIAHMTPGRLQRDIGVISCRLSRASNERVVGMATIIADQGLRGVRKLTQPATWGDHKGWHNVAMWCDPRLEAMQETYGQRFAGLVPADSFVMVDRPHTVHGRTLIDPASYVAGSKEFQLVPGVTTDDATQSVADGIGSTATTRTYLHRASRYFLPSP